MAAFGVDVDVVDQTVANDFTAIVGWQVAAADIPRVVRRSARNVATVVAPRLTVEVYEGAVVPLEGAVVSKTIAEPSEHFDVDLGACAIANGLGEDARTVVHGGRWVVVVGVDVGAPQSVGAVAVVEREGARGAVGGSEVEGVHRIGRCFGQVDLVAIVHEEIQRGQIKAAERSAINAVAQVLHVANPVDAKGDADHRKQCPEVVFLTRLLGERQTGGHTATTATTTTKVEVPADVAEQAQGGRTGVVDHLSKPDVGSHQRVAVACRVVRFVPMAVAGARFKGVRRKKFGVGPAVGVDALGAVPKQVAAFQLCGKCGGVVGVAEDGHAGAVFHKGVVDEGGAGDVQAVFAHAAIHGSRADHTQAMPQFVQHDRHKVKLVEGRVAVGAQVPVGT